MHFNHKLTLLGALLLAISLSAFGVANVTAQEDMQVAASAQLVDTAGNPVGTVRFVDEQEYGTIAIIVQAQNLTPGFHGFHLHETGQCDPAADPPFSSAGGHLNLTGAAHPSHEGDFPTLLVMQDGTAAMSFRTDRFTIADLLDADGSALVVHSGPDNYANIPADYLQEGEQLLESTTSSGDGGDRVACGVVAEGDLPAAEPQGTEPAVETTAEPVATEAMTEPVATEAMVEPMGTEAMVEPVGTEAMIEPAVTDVMTEPAATEPAS